MLEMILATMYPTTRSRRAARTLGRKLTIVRSMLSTWRSASAVLPSIVHDGTAAEIPGIPLGGARLWRQIRGSDREDRVVAVLLP